MCVTDIHPSTGQGAQPLSEPKHWDLGPMSELGLVSLGPELLAILQLIDRQFTRWAAEQGAEEWQYPPLLRVADLRRVDFFRNFPHLCIPASGLRPEVLGGYASGAHNADALPQTHLSDSAHVLPTAACFNVYFQCRGQRLHTKTWRTTRVQCFRNEKYFQDLRRLWGFNMREIICLGEPGSFEHELTRLGEKIMEWARHLGLQLRSEVASDPFFDRNSPRAIAQNIFPVKEEIVDTNGLAIASINRHRNFFGERCDISWQGERPVHTACVAFGLERWLHVLLERYAGDTAAILEKLAP